MPGLEDLYREIILDHYRTPRNRGELPTPPAVMAEGHNPLCGDEITIYLLVDGETVDDVKVSGQGCSISQSSASMMSQAVKGKPIGQVRALIRRFLSMMSTDDTIDDTTNDTTNDTTGDTIDDTTNDTTGAAVGLGDLEALQGVVKFPVRIKCATLAWHTLRQALNEADTNS